MKITSVECSATFNLGNYQSVKFGFTADIEHDKDGRDEVADAMAELRRLINTEAVDQGVKPNQLLKH